MVKSSKFNCTFDKYYLNIALKLQIFKCCFNSSNKELNKFGNLY